MKKVEKGSTLSGDEIKSNSPDYEISEQVFLDLWKEWGKPEEFNDSEEIFGFLADLLKRQMVG